MEHVTPIGWAVLGCLGVLTLANAAAIMDDLDHTGAPRRDDRHADIEVTRSTHCRTAMAIVVEIVTQGGLTPHLFEQCETLAGEMMKEATE